MGYTLLWLDFSSPCSGMHCRKDPPFRYRCCHTHRRLFGESRTFQDIRFVWFAEAPPFECMGALWKVRRLEIMDRGLSHSVAWVQIIRKSCTAVLLGMLSRQRSTYSQPASDVASPT
ncbi:unnamed protein product [Periconia digitata]|uniref:Uncharacterized protein n=1 Tax=Periconia digitata TaxID=1303443 RepID=A0A9W4UCH5_9PLEO|nr:unnamed protein product [Periconia digitata]